MKKLFATLFLFSLSLAQAQSVSDYKYVIVPHSFQDFEKNDYQLNTYLKTLLRKKKYEIVVEGSIDLPNDLKTNPCLATKANIQDNNSSFQNRIKVTFTDCKNQIITELEGSSKIKELDKGYQDALNIALTKLAVQNAKEFVKVNSKPQDNTNNSTFNASVKSDSKNLFTAQGKNYELIELSSKKRKLIDLSNQKIIAYIYPSSQWNVVHVEILSDEGNYNTLGFIEDEKLIIEFKTDRESWEKTEFSRK